MIKPEQKAAIEELVEEYALNDPLRLSGLRLNSISCVALPTCALALAEAERYLPDVIGQLEEVLDEAGLRSDAITIRMTGCPNGCARPYIAEIGFVGRGPDRYNVYLGAGFVGDRLSKLWRKDVKGTEIKELLTPVIQDYAKSREDGERFGDFVIRAGYVKATKEGRDFHADIEDSSVSAYA